MFDERDVLLKAAERISEEGKWCQGFWHYVPKDIEADYQNAKLGIGPVGGAVFVQERGLRVPECLEGAVASAALALADSAKVADLLFWSALSRLKVSWAWNDAAGRTADEVAAALRGAAL